MLSDHKIVFEMDRIYTLQSKLDSLVADVDNGGRLRKEEAMTFLTEHYRTPYHRRRYRCLACGTRWSTLELRVVDLADRVNTSCDA